MSNNHNRADIMKSIFSFDCHIEKPKTQNPEVKIVICLRSLIPLISTSGLEEILLYGNQPVASGLMFFRK